jgi:hypothetical protein
MKGYVCNLVWDNNGGLLKGVSVNRGRAAMGDNEKVMSIDRSETALGVLRGETVFGVFKGYYYNLGAGLS